MSWVVDWRRSLWLTGLLLALPLGLHARDVQVLVLGDSVSDSCLVKEKSVPTATPGTCRLDPFWEQLPRLFPSTDEPTSIRFTTIIASGSSIGDWQPSGSMGRLLETVLKDKAMSGTRYDYAVWQQGAHEPATHRQVYFGKLFDLMRSTSSQIPIRRWLVATHSSCGTAVKPSIAQAQRQAGNFRLAHRYPGADLDTLPRGAWQAGCRLTPLGEHALAQRWAQAILTSDAEAGPLESESLLTFFRGLTSSSTR